MGWVGMSCSSAGRGAAVLWFGSQGGFFSAEECAAYDQEGGVDGGHACYLSGGARGLSKRQGVKVEKWLE